MFLKELIRWVIKSKQPNYSWDYTFPKSQSGIGPDNYHTGGVLDGIWDYLKIENDPGIRETFEKGLDFYQGQLFTSVGAPKWRVEKDFPHDIHGSAQGILTFSKARRLEQAQKILKWTLEHMQDKRGYFYYQKRRFYTWKADFMRWNNSWMFLALAEYQQHVDS